MVVLEPTVEDLLLCIRVVLTNQILLVGGQFYIPVAYVVAVVYLEY